MRSADLSSPGLQPLRGVGLALVAAGCILFRAPVARADPTAAGTTPAATSKSSPMKPYNPGSQSRRSRLGDQWYAARFGIDQMHVRSVSSGSSIEFRYRVLDADKASVLTDRNATPYLIDQETGTRLDVPVMEQVGALRQTATPRVGKEYWMMFANRTKSVKPGRHVDIFCGALHIRGLTVE